MKTALIYNWYKMRKHVLMRQNLMNESESVSHSVLSLRDPMDCSPPGSSAIEFSRQEWWSGEPFPFPGDLPDPGIEPRSTALQADSLPSEPLGNVYWFKNNTLYFICKNIFWKCMSFNLTSNISYRHLRKSLG